MSYTFDGSTGYAYLGTASPFPGNSARSAVAWVKVADDATARTVFFVTSDDFVYTAMQVLSSETPQAINRTNADGTAYGTATSAIATGAWAMVHIRETSAYKFYGGHGAANEGSTGNFTPDGARTKIHVGRLNYAGTPSAYFKGEIGILTFYNIDLSGAQLTELLTTDPASASTSGNRVAYYDLRTDHGTTTLTDSVGSYHLALSGSTKPSYTAGGPTFALKYLKLLAHASAASAASIEGVVLNSTRDTVIGEFSGQAFDATLAAAGEAVLYIPCADISPDGSTLTTSDTPLAVAYNATYTTPLVSTTVIEA